MLVINNKWRFEGSISDMMDNFSIDAKCLCGLEIKKYTDCEASILGLDMLEEITF